MKRENLRFRAWDRVKRKMIYFGLYSLLVDGTENSKGWLRHYENGMSDLEVMQHAGFRDRNTNDIFEGDFVEDSFGHVYLIEWVETEGTLKARIVEEGQLYQYRHFKDIQFMKVIGNIFENSELLIKC